MRKTKWFAQNGLLAKALKRMGLFAMGLIYQSNDELRLKHLLFVNFHGNISDREAGQCNGLAYNRFDSVILVVLASAYNRFDSVILVEVIGGCIFMDSKI